LSVIAAMSDERRRGRWFWHCHACGKYVPREQQQCSCGASKQQRMRRSDEARPRMRGKWGLAFGVGVVVLWLVLLWMVVREHTPAPPRRRGAGVEPLMTQVALDSRPHSADTFA
jgi:hypothetical protein